MLRLVAVVFTIQAGFHGFTGALPVALAGAGLSTTDIGLVVGSASLSMIVAAPVGGALLDRLGSYRMLTFGGMTYVAGALVLATTPLAADTPLWPLLLARSLQGIGFAVVIPSALTLVPRVVEDVRRGFWLTFTLLSQNMTLAIMPAISLVVLRATSLSGVAAMIAVLAVVGMLLVRVLPRPMGSVSHSRHPAARRRLGLAYRAQWTAPLGVALLGVAYWGLLLAHLPPRAEAAGANAALYFIGYGVAVIATRLPSGWLADRYPARLLVLGGLAISLIAIALLVPPPSDGLLTVSGALSGTASGLLMSPLLLELSNRSSSEDRGSAFAMFAVATGSSNALGSIVGGSIIDAFGFSAALAAGSVSIGLAGVVALADGSFKRRSSPI